jgi:hypothetical protein
MAFDAGAVGETLAGAGVLIREKTFDRIAEMAHLLVHDEGLRERVVAEQNRVLQRRLEADEEALLMDFVERTRG